MGVVSAYALSWRRGVAADVVLALDHPAGAGPVLADEALVDGIAARERGCGFRVAERVIRV